jgi:hypothetical protein
VVAKLGGDWMQGKRSRVAKVTAACGRARLQLQLSLRQSWTVPAEGREGDAGLAAA